MVDENVVDENVVYANVVWDNVISECVWCGKLEKGGTYEGEFSIKYGICKECYDNY